MVWVACPFETGRVTWHECMLAIIAYMCPRSRRQHPFHWRDFDLVDEALGTDALPTAMIDPYEERVVRRVYCGNGQFFCREQFLIEDDEETRLHLLCNGASRRYTDQITAHRLAKARGRVAPWVCTLNWQPIVLPIKYYRETPHRHAHLRRHNVVTLDVKYAEDQRAKRGAKV